MRKRLQRFEELPRGCGNIEYYGLRKGQIVHVNATSAGYQGVAKIVGTPPQGTGIYLVTPHGEKLWLIGEEIVEATEPS